MANLSRIKVDSRKIEEGVWVDCGGYVEELRGASVRVRGFGNKDELRILSEGRQSIARLSDEDNRDLMSRRLKGAILMDWSDMENDDGPLPFNDENVAKYIEDPDYRIFRDMVVAIAQDVAAGKAKERETKLGN